MGIGLSSSFTGCYFSCRISTSHNNGLMRLMEPSGIKPAAAAGAGSPSISLPIVAEVSMQSLKNKLVHMISVISNQKENQTTRYQPKNPRTYHCFFSCYGWTRSLLVHQWRPQLQVSGRVRSEKRTPE